MILIVGESGAPWKYFGEIMYSCERTIKYYRNKMGSGQGEYFSKLLTIFQFFLKLFYSREFRF